MPRRRPAILSAAVVVALTTALGVLLTVGSYDTSALPGVPASHLREQRLEIDPSDASGFVVRPESARRTADYFLGGGADISEAIPVVLRSDEYPLLNGLAWAVVFDTSTGSHTPMLSGIAHWQGYVMTSHDYYVAFIDGECGHFLRTLWPGIDYSRFASRLAEFEAESEPVPTRLCPYPSAPD